MAYSSFPSPSDPIARSVGCSYLVEGCVISQNGNNFDISEGTLRFFTVDEQGRAFARTSIFPAQSNIVPANNPGTNWIFINSNLQLEQDTAQDEGHDEVNNRVQVGVVNVASGGVILSVIPATAVSMTNIPSTLWDLQKTTRPLRRFGIELQPNATNLILKSTEGQFFFYALNSVTDPTSPNLISLNEIVYSDYIYVNRDLSSVVVKTGITPGSYDLAGTITPMPSSNWSVQRVYINIAGNIFIQYGQETYIGANNALAGVSSERFIKPSALDGAYFAGYIVIRADCVNLANIAKCVIINPPQVNGENNVTYS